MKNKKAILGLLIIAVLLIGGFLTKQVTTQLGLGFPFSNLANVLTTDRDTDGSVTNVSTVVNPGNPGDPRNPTNPGNPGGSPGREAGWTTFTPSATSQIVYLSSTGSDTANCVYTVGGTRPFGGSDPFNPTNTITPCKTLQSNYDNDQKIRPGQDDFLLLKRGDTWNNENFDLDKDGRSPTLKQVIGSWSPAGAPNTNRPRLNISASQGDAINGYGLNNVAIIDLHLYLNVGATSPVQYSSGVTFVGSTSATPPQDIVFENLKIERFERGIYLGKGDSNVRVKNITIRRNIIADAFCTNQCSGILTDGDNLLVEENVFSHNGILNNLSGYASSIFNHNAYMSYSTGDGTNTTVKGNFVLRGADGGKFGSINGGDIIDNAFIQQAMAVLECCEDGQRLMNNVVMYGLDYNSGDRRAVGFHIGSPNNVTVSGNVFAHQLAGGPNLGTDNAEAIAIDGGSQTTISGNVFYDWCLAGSTGLMGFAIAFPSSGALSSTVQIRDNQFQQNCGSGQFGRIMKQSAVGPTYRNNKYWVNSGGSGGSSAVTAPQGYQYAPGQTFSQWQAASGETGTWQQIAYTAPNRDAATYYNSLFPPANHAFRSQAGIDALDAKLRLQSKWNWDTRLTAGAFNDYIRCGFNMAPLNGSCDGDNIAPTVSLTAPANGATVNGTVAVTATATDNVGVTKVEFFQGTTRIGEDTTASAGNVYTIDWNTRINTPNGPYSITAKAWDAAQNNATSPARNVTVNNVLPPGCEQYDMDSSGSLTPNDFATFQTLYNAGNIRADMDGNNILNANDYVRFLNGYVGCIS